MSERRPPYHTNSENASQPIDACAILETDLYVIRDELEEIERRLIPLLVAVQRALGKEPSVITRAERRKT